MNLCRLDPKSADQVLYVSFNQDFGCFSVGTSSGFRIYNCNTFGESFSRDLNGSIGMVEMLFHSNILALVGGGKNPCFPPSKVMIWNDTEAKVVGEFPHRTEVRSVKLRTDKLVVALDQSVHVYDIYNVQRIRKYDTAMNAKGLVGLSPHADAAVLCCPALQRGWLRVANLTTGKEDLVSAHEAPLAFIALNHDGTRIATASEKGTLLRVYATHPDGGSPPTLLKEVRRGLQYAEIYSVNFSPDSQFLVVASGRGTIHVFDLGAAPPSPGDPGGSVETNRKSTFGFLASLNPYFGSEWSFAWYRGPEVPCLCAFGADGLSILVVAANGQFLRLAFQRHQGGEMECTESQFYCTGLRF